MASQRHYLLTMRRGSILKSKISRLIAFTAPSLREAQATKQSRSFPTRHCEKHQPLPSLRGALAPKQSSPPVIARSASSEAIQPSRHCHLTRHCEKHQPLPSLRGALAPKQSSPSVIARSASSEAIQPSRHYHLPLHCEKRQPLPSLRGAQRRRNPALKARFHISLPSLDSYVQLKLAFFF